MEETPDEGRFSETGNSANGNGSGGRDAGGPSVVTPERVAANGNGNGHGPTYSRFWHGPVADHQEIFWLNPPLPEREAKGERVEGLLDELGGFMENNQQRAWLLKWNYHTRSSASASELDDVEREARLELDAQYERAEKQSRLLDSEIDRLHEERLTVEEDLKAAHKAFAESIAEAGLTCESGGEISPERVEAALQSTTPKMEEMAGEHNISPHLSNKKTAVDKVVQFLAPLVCGFMLAVCLGTLIGILSLNDLRRGDRLAPLGMAAALGFVIVALMGELVATSVYSLARCLETRREADANPSLVPQLHRGAVMASILLGFAGVLGLAEITAEGVGIRELHAQYRESALDASNTTKELPLGLYMLMGALISGPFLGYKAAKAWSEGEARLRESWLFQRQRVWLDARRARPEVRQAFQHAYRVEQLASKQRDLIARLLTLEEQRSKLRQIEPDAAMQARRNEARAAAVGEAGRLQQMVEQIVETNEPLPVRTSPLTGGYDNHGVPFRAPANRQG